MRLYKSYRKKLRCIKAFAPQKRVWCSNPSCNTPKSWKQVATDQMPHARHYVWVSRIIGDHYTCKMMRRVTLGVVRKRASLLNGHECRTWVNICSPSPAMVNLQKSEKISMGRKLQPNKQTNKLFAIKLYDKNIFVLFGIIKYL